MIIEFVIGGIVFILAAIGTYSSFRSAQQKLSRWQTVKPVNEPKRMVSPIDPTPSFTVELVRTVLEHQAKREDQSRRELTMLTLQMAATFSQQPEDRLTTMLPENDSTLLPRCEESISPPVHDGIMCRTLRRILPGWYQGKILERQLQSA